MCIRDRPASGIYHNSEAVGSGYAAACAEAGGYASEGKALEGDRPVDVYKRQIFPRT